jgi:serine/threonine-protein kinase RsbW
VTRMNRWLDDAFVEAGTAAPVADDLKLCLNEAVANAMLYGFRDTVAPEIDIEIGLGRASASAVLTDNGKPFNPLDWPQRPKLTRLEDATIGGFGIQLIRQTATSVDYDRIDGRNRLSVICGAQD